MGSIRRLETKSNGVCHSCFVILEWILDGNGRRWLVGWSVGWVRKQDMVKIGMDSFVLAGPIRPELETKFSRNMGWSEGRELRVK